MLKRISVLSIAILVLSGCEDREIVTSQDFHTSSILSVATFKPTHRNYEYGYDWTTGKIGLHFVTHPDEYRIVFQTVVGSFSFMSREMYETYHNYVGRELDLVYREEYLVTYEPQAERGGVKKERSRVFIRNVFMKAIPR